MINVNGLKRNAKNIVKKYSDAQIKVREATSNDPWGPSSTIMAEIADLTYNVVAFSEIMAMIWKRLNDHGKNWRHVYKALVVLEYLIKTGTDKVAEQCRENIFSIQTLNHFQHMEENKDLGMNVREKSKALVALLKDGEKLKNERARALKAKERLSESMSSMTRGSSHSSSSETPPQSSTSLNNSFDVSNNSSTSSAIEVAAANNSELENARPQTASEEENQLQIALALSKEEADEQEKIKRNDELRLKLALDASKKAASTSPSASTSMSKTATTSNGPSTIDDLLGLSVTPQPDPVVNTSSNLDPWIVNSNRQQTVHSAFDPWEPTPNDIPSMSQANTSDPWKTASTTTQSTASDSLFDLWKSQPPAPSALASIDPWETAPTSTHLATSSHGASDPWKKPMSKNPFAD